MCGSERMKHSRLNDTQAAEKQLDEQVKSLRHEVERRVKAPGTDLKAAPFQSAATLKPLSAYTEVLVLIVTPHWLGVETPEGQRGWIPRRSTGATSLSAHMEKSGADTF